MSKFQAAMVKLAFLKKPLFDEMYRTGRAKPMALGIFHVISEGLEDQQKAAVKKGLRCLSSSRRYRVALAQPGAFRHDLDGNPVAEVSEEHRGIALESIGKIAAAKFNPAVVSPPPRRPILTLKGASA